MGVCAFKNKIEESSEVSQRIPEFHYLCRKTNSIMRSKGGVVESIPFDPNIKICEDSVIGVVGKSHIVALGGKDSNGKPSQKVYITNTTTNSTYRLGDLPENILTGSAFFYDKYLYALNNNPIKLLAYNFDKKDWTEQEISYKHSRYGYLKNFSSFLKGDIVFIVSAEYKSKNTRKIFCIRMDNWYLSQYESSIPEVLINPICVGYSGGIIVGGGLNSQGRPNTKFYYESPDHNWATYEVPNKKIIEVYPPMITPELIFFSYPIVLVGLQDKYTVFNLKYSYGDDKNINHPSHQNGRIMHSETGNEEEKLHLNKQGNDESLQKTSLNSKSLMKNSSKQSLDSNGTPKRPKKNKDDIKPTYSDLKSPKLPSNFTEKPSVSNSIN